MLDMQERPQSQQEGKRICRMYVHPCKPHIHNVYFSCAKIYLPGIPAMPRYDSQVETVETCVRHVYLKMHENN